MTQNDTTAGLSAILATLDRNERSGGRIEDETGELLALASGGTYLVSIDASLWHKHLPAKGAPVHPLIHGVRGYHKLLDLTVGWDQLSTARFDGTLDADVVAERLGLNDRALSTERAVELRDTLGGWRDALIALDDVEYTDHVLQDEGQFSGRSSYSGRRRLSLDKVLTEFTDFYGIDPLPKARKAECLDATRFAQERDRVATLVRETFVSTADAVNAIVGGVRMSGRENKLRSQLINRLNAGREMVEFARTTGHCASVRYQEQGVPDALILAVSPNRSDSALKALCEPLKALHAADVPAEYVHAVLGGSGFYPALSYDAWRYSKRGRAESLETAQAIVEAYAAGLPAEYAVEFIATESGR